MARGDKNPFRLMGQALHAGEIGFVHPTTGAYLEFSVEPPEEIKKDFERIAEKSLKSEKNCVII